MYRNTGVVQHYFNWFNLKGVTMLLGTKIIKPQRMLFVAMTMLLGTKMIKPQRMLLFWWVGCPFYLSLSTLTMSEAIPKWSPFPFSPNPLLSVLLLFLFFLLHSFVQKRFLQHFKEPLINWLPLLLKSTLCKCILWVTCSVCMPVCMRAGWVDVGVCVRESPSLLQLYNSGWAWASPKCM